MKHAARGLTRSFALLVVATALNAPPSAAAEAIDLRPLAGLPNVALGDGHPLVWKRFGIVAESALIDVNATLSTRVTAAPLTSDAVGNNALCSDSCQAERTVLGHEAGITLKIPRWSDDSPLIDVVLRRWSMQPALASSGEPASGSSAGVDFTQPLGAFDVLLGLSRSVFASVEQGNWMASYAGVSWHAGRGTTLEFVADRTVDAGSGLADRTLTVRFLHATADRRIRFAAWTMRSLDDHGPLRIGAGIDASF